MGQGYLREAQLLDDRFFTGLEFRVPGSHLQGQGMPLRLEFSVGLGDLTVVGLPLLRFIVGGQVLSGNLSLGGLTVNRGLPLGVLDGQVTVRPGPRRRGHLGRFRLGQGRILPVQGLRSSRWASTRRFEALGFVWPIRHEACPSWPDPVSRMAVLVYCVRRLAGFPRWRSAYFWRSEPSGPVP